MVTFAGQPNTEPELNITEWAKFRRSFLINNTYHPEIWDSLSTYQKQWTKDTMNTLKDIGEEE